MKQIILLGFYTILSFVALAQSPTEIHVNGHAELSVKPTKIVLSMAINTDGANYAEALDRLVQRVNLLSDQLKKAKVPTSDLVTSNFNIHKNFVFEHGVRKDKGFVANQSLSVTLSDDKKRLLEVLNAATNSNADPEINISFVLDNDSKKLHSEKLIHMAVKDAQKKAQIIADASGYKVVGVASIRYGHISDPRPLYATRMNAMESTLDAQVTNLEVGNLLLSEKVEAIYIVEKL